MVLQFCLKKLIYYNVVPLNEKYVPGNLKKVCKALVDHITNVSYEKIIIQRMVAYFKIDEKERIYFLWAGSIRIKEVSLQLIKF